MKLSDLDFVRLALSRGWIAPEWHDRALGEADRLQALGLDKSADEILLEGGVLSARQVRRLREELGWVPARPRIGGYEVIRRVGLGGMGTVFEARHVRLRQRIALKILLPQYARDPVLAGRFLQEARTLARLNHRHLVHALDAGRDGDYYYLAMEYVEGEDLRQLLAREKRMSPRRSLETVRAVCEALVVLESKGLVHRDIKPANILIDRDGVVKLADLGLLRIREVPGPRGDRFVCGTPQYVSPEQAFHRDDIDVRSDLYALAATWFHLVVGRPPFTGRSSGEVLRAHREKDPPLPSSLRPDLPRPLERVLLRWLSKDREERPGSAAEAVEELDALAARLDWGRAALSRVLGGFRRWTRWGPPAHSLKVALCALALVGLAGLGLVLLGPSGDRDPGPGATPPTGPGDVAVASQDDGSPEPPAPEEPTDRSAAAEDSPAPAGESPVRIEKPAEPGRGAGPALPLPGSELPSEATTAESFEGSTGPLRETPAGLAEGVPSITLDEALRRGTLGMERLRTRGAGLWRSLLELERGFDGLRPLAETFHATVVALEPGEQPSRRVLLRYSFEHPDELDDFRASSGSWEVIDGRLVSLSRPAGEWLETVTWFQPPVHVRGVLDARAPLTVSLGTIRVAPGGGGEAGSSGGRLWLEAGEAEASSPAIPIADEGSFSVSFLDNSVELTGRGLRRRFPGRSAGAGRVRVRVGEGASLLRLELEGTLEPTWARERLRILRG